MSTVYSCSRMDVYTCVVHDRKDMVVPSLIAKRSCRLIVRNLHFKATPESLLELFGPYGPIREISIPLKDGEEAKLAVSDFPSLATVVRLTLSSTLLMSSCTAHITRALSLRPSFTLANSHRDGSPLSFPMRTSSNGFVCVSGLDADQRLMGADAKRP